MSFEPIGPYALTRGDFVAASLIISFRTGGKSARIRAVLMISIGFIFIVAGFISDDWGMAGFGLVFVVFLFVVAPALRSPKDSRSIVLEAGPEGLIADTDRCRTIYKWSTIRSVKPFGSRLIIMITDGCALVVPTHATNPENIARLVGMIEKQQRALLA